MFLALLLAFVLILSQLDPSGKDLRLLFIFMSGSGTLTILSTYLLYRRGVMRWFNSLRWTLLATIVLTVVLIFVNVWLTAQLMFISRHDLILTTALLIFAGVIAIISLFFFSGVLIDRIHDLGKTAESLAGGNLGARLEIQGYDELAQLAETFNMMADALQAVDEQKRLLEKTRRDLIAWVSHDLRTPLAAIQAMNEAILDGVADDPDTINRYMLNTKKEIQHLSHLITDLFELAQLDIERLQMHVEPTNMTDLVSDALSSMSVRAAQEEITLCGKLPHDLPLVPIAHDKIQRVLYNLLDNALRHTPAGGTITLGASPRNGHLHMSVHNTGSYIAPEHLPHIFKSFYRGESSRAQQENGYRGTGLGLAIARGFIEAHGGKIWVESRIEAGTAFQFTLPLK